MADIEIKDIATEQTAPATTDWLVGQEAAGGADSTFKISLATLQASPFGIALAGDNTTTNPADNYAEPGASAACVVGGGTAAAPNRIGVAGTDPGVPRSYALPVGTDLNPGWGVDSGYVAASADYTGILGGYDNVCNAIGSFINGSNHSMISYGTDGHNLIAGGSYNWIAGAAARSTIVGARQSSIQDGNYNVILGADNSDITATGDRNCIIGASAVTLSGSGSNNVILGAGGTVTLSAGSYQLVLGGENNGISSSGNRNITAGGSNNAITGTTGGGALLGGDSNSIASANYAAVVGGEDNACTLSHAVLMGSGAKSVVRGGLHNGRTVTAVGDCQSVSVVMGARTTDATATNLTAVGGGLIELDDAKVNTGTGTVWVTGVNEADGTQVAYKTDFGFMWNGTNGFLFKTGTETSVTTSPTLNLDLISQTNNDFTAADVELRINTGSLRVNVTGIAATNIRWAARIDLVTVNY